MKFRRLVKVVAAIFGIVSRRFYRSTPLNGPEGDVLTVNLLDLFWCDMMFTHFAFGVLCVSDSLCAFMSIFHLYFAASPSRNTTHTHTHIHEYIHIHVWIVVCTIAIANKAHLHNPLIWRVVVSSVWSWNMNARGPNIIIGININECNANICALVSRDNLIALGENACIMRAQCRSPWCLLHYVRWWTIAPSIQFHSVYSDSFTHRCFYFSFFFFSLSKYTINLWYAEIVKLMVHWAARS